MTELQASGKQALLKVQAFINKNNPPCLYSEQEGGGDLERLTVTVNLYLHG